jgi:hypothetical protein
MRILLDAILIAAPPSLSSGCSSHDRPSAKSNPACHCTSLAAQPQPAPHAPPRVNARGVEDEPQQ